LLIASKMFPDEQLEFATECFTNRMVVLLMNQKRIFDMKGFWFHRHNPPQSYCGFL